jgi:transcriptional regulatory protein LevR
LPLARKSPATAAIVIAAAGKTTAGSIAAVDTCAPALQKRYRHAISMKNRRTVST